MPLPFDEPFPHTPTLIDELSQPNAVRIDMPSPAGAVPS